METARRRQEIVYVSRKGSVASGQSLMSTGEVGPGFWALFCDLNARC